MRLLSCASPLVNSRQFRALLASLVHKGMQSALGQELQEPPSDGISSLRFASHADLLLTASWDSHVRLYDAVLNSCRVAFKQRAPVLDAAFLVRERPQQRAHVKHCQGTLTPAGCARRSRPRAGHRRCCERRA